MSGDQSATGQLEHQLYVVLLAQMKHAMDVSRVLSVKGIP